MKQKTKRSVEIICYLEISIMILGMISFSYMMSDALNENKIQTNENKFGKFLEFIINNLKKPVIASVSAEASVFPYFNVCCEKTKEGAFCQNTLEENCDEGFRKTPTSCEATSFCKPGCCYDSTEGMCMPNTPQKVCEEDGGIWNEDAECNIPQCQLGCCIIGEQANFATLTRCKRLSTLYGLGIDFRTNVEDELSCIALAQSQDIGACVFQDEFFENTCKFTTRGDCLETFKGTFHKDHLCTDEELGTICAKTKNTVCVDGKEEVYFVDSCGNPANIYDASKVEDNLYWKEIVSKEASCSAKPNDKNCGNCDYFEGNICSESSGLARPTYGENICKDLNCKDENGKEWKHGESWCEYDGNIGAGTDAVGSRHYRKICANGEILIEPCADYRNEYCLQDTTETSTGDFTEAACLVNRWNDCVDQLEEKDCLDTQNRDCYWIQGKDFAFKQAKTTTGTSGTSTSTLSTFSGGTTGGFTTTETPAPKAEGVCLPEIPPGMKFWAQQETATVCSLANKKCTYTKTTKIGSESEENAECLTAEWLDDRNRVCSSLGDCGAYVNYNNDYTYDGALYQINGGKARDLSPEKTFGAVLYNTALERAGIINKERASPLINSPLLNPIAKAFAALGLATGMGAVNALVPSASGSILGWFGKIGTKIFPSASGGGSAVLGVLIQNLIVAGIAAGIGYVVGKNIGLGGNADVALATAMGVGTFSGLIMTDIASAATTSFMEEGWLITNPLFAPWQSAALGIGVGVAVAALIFIAMYKKVDKQIITFTCLPWEAPWGGENCQLCNEGDLQCSEYRCKSLGKGCEIVNAGSEQEKCVWKNPRDVTTPGIKPLENATDKIPTPGHKYTEVRIRPAGDGSEPGRMRIINTESEDGCLEAFTPIEFGIETFNENNEPEPTECKIDFVHKENYDNMSYYMGQNNLLSEKHIEKLALPGQSDELIEALELKNDGLMNFYIRCADANKNANVDEYQVSFCVQAGPDTTPPKIEGFNIPSGNPVQYNLTQLDLEVYVNEPADCRWSRTDTAYDNMPNQMICANSAEEMNANLIYTCETTLTGIQSRTENKYYIRCKDNPGKEEADRNPNMQSYAYIVTGTQALNILDAQPDGETISGSTEVVPVFINMTTDNGYKDGESICFYSTTDNEKGYVAFAENEGREHSQRQDLVPGEYKYYLKCVDLGGNADYISISFIVESDKTTPIIVRAYRERETLKILTNENAKCSYSNIDCNFEIDEGILMAGIEKSHTSNWGINTYYIRCKDKYENQPYSNSCSIIVKPWEMILNN
ncbi:MAG: hypothetical protein WC438_00860 [Candidatus Pacearchaeota archaeon]